MTPTRTETTLRRNRRVYERITLNNTHSHSRSPDATRPRAEPSARPTVATRASDEQKSNNIMPREHTKEQLINWVMSKDAVASCFIKDVLSMSESEHVGLPYYILGRVPCRSVFLVAVVVGAVAYEHRLVYTLDDGTGTIECAFRLDGSKPESKSSEKQRVAPFSRVPTDRTKPVTQQRDSSRLIPVGSVVRIQGRVRVKQTFRDIHGESIERCKGVREELEHWRQVTSLHKTYYFLPEPFVVPPSSTTAAVSTRDVPTTPKSAKGTISLASTPSTSHSTASSSTTSSPAKSSDDSSLLPRLRHPSRLHSRDLTENTFRIYVKHFMDNLRYLNFGPQSCESDLDSDTDSIAAAIDNTPATPTKKRPPNSGDERTPRLSRHDSNLTTPRPRPRPAPASRLHPDGHYDDKDAVIGCTLSFLLRVPELVTLASRVAQAEARRREKTGQSQEAVASKTLSSSAGKHRTLASSTEGTVPKAKRLFSWAIRKLYQDGSIILWDGPALSVLEPRTPFDSSMLYRPSQEDNINDRRSSAVSSRSRLAASRHGTQLAVDYIDDLSDPPSDEEAYASLSAAYLATQVEQAIRSLTAQQTRRKGETENTFLGPAVSRRRLLPLPGPTKEDITTHLKRRDDRWKRIHDWAVQEALEWLKDNGRAWCVSEDGGGRWELCS